jgi:hypothetical protein
MNKLKIYFDIMCDFEILLKSLKIALVVGTILNFINQGDKLIAMDFENLNHFKSILTYMIPFIVSSYTAFSIKMKFKIGEITHVSANLKCEMCGSGRTVKANSIIPVCQNCNEKTKWRIS